MRSEREESEGLLAGPARDPLWIDRRRTDGCADRPGIERLHTENPRSLGSVRGDGESRNELLVMAGARPAGVENLALGAEVVG